MTAGFLSAGPEDGPLLVLAHGAGEPMDSKFLEAVAAGLAARGIRTERFEFPYMALRRTQGARRAPDREPVLLDAWRAAVRSAGGPDGLVIGGKSMGGRMASMVCDELGVAGVACLGYPFHPPGKPAQLRVAHLAQLVTPALIVQGERDPFGNRDEAAAYSLSPRVEICWLPDGDHSWRPRKASGATLSSNIELGVDAVAAFVRRVRS
jgi:predicted alpha/beta-hydrolase family hydrolase